MVICTLALSEVPAVAAIPINPLVAAKSPVNAPSSVPINAFSLVDAAVDAAELREALRADDKPKIVGVEAPGANSMS